MPDFAIVTGASQNHFKTLKQFLSTINKKIVRCYVYDLGLSETSRNEIKSMEDVYFRSFDYSKYPSYYNININAGEYAWKPAIINELTSELIEEGLIKYILWCDSGNKLLDPTIQRIQSFLDVNYIYSPSSAGDIMKWTHPLTLKWFLVGDRSKILTKTNRNGAILGFNISKPEIVEFIKEFARCAAIKECIAPEGSSRRNHRQDQAVFTILYYKLLDNHPDLVIEDKYLDITIHNDIDYC